MSTRAEAIAVANTATLGPPAPLWVRLVLVALLPLIALGIYVDGQSYESGLLELHNTTTAGQLAGQLLPAELLGLSQQGRPRSYHKDNLYEYINGHAEYYLSAGFQGLAVGEYGPQDSNQPSLVVNLYHMGKPLHAFGALMDELSDSAQPLDLGSMGFGEDQGANLIIGPYYVQISAFEPTLEVSEAARQLAAALEAGVPQDATLDLRFPQLGEPLDTYFVKEGYRGIGVLNNVLERIFMRDGEEITAFMITGSSAEITTLTQQLTEFLRSDGIPFALTEEGSNRWYRVDDPYEGEWFFVPTGERLIGVFTAATAPLLAKLLPAPEAPAPLP